MSFNRWTPGESDGRVVDLGRILLSDRRELGIPRGVIPFTFGSRRWSYCLWMYPAQGTFVSSSTSALPYFGNRQAYRQEGSE
jgi:hypothetical protein